MEEKKDIYRIHRVYKGRWNALFQKIILEEYVKSEDVSDFEEVFLIKKSDLELIIEGKEDERNFSEDI